VIVGLLHPGEMGSAVGRVLCGNGHDVLWASEGRSDATRERAAGFRDVRTVAELAGEAELVLSICPPHAAVAVAQEVEGFAGVYVDANAISPMRAREVAALQPRFVDGGIVGGPPDEPGTTLYLSGDGAAAVASLFSGSVLQARVVQDASAVKMVYAAWSKGTAAMLLAVRDVAREFGVEEEWRLAVPELLERLERAEASAAAKAWRWIGEMEEIADTFEAAGKPDGFHRAAAEVYRAAGAARAT
jgi:3-hydroxyisobutyrate dehydrogenase-like beta-hydroxyacid dehydrogenase